MTVLNVVGSRLVAQAQTVIVIVVISILVLFAVRHPGQHRPVAARALWIPTVP